jgi:spore germination protein GerM
MKRLLAALVCLLVASCSSGTQLTIIPAEDLPESIYSTDERNSTQAQTDRRVVIYFVRRLSESSFVLEPVVRTGRTGLSAADFAMEHLLAGQLRTEEERAMKLGTAIPSETELLGLEVEDRVAEVNLSSAFEDPEDELTHLLRLSQVVWTLTELGDVESVRFLIHGVAQPVITEDGPALEEVGRGRYQRFAPLTEEPVPVA